MPNAVAERPARIRSQPRTPANARTRTSRGRTPPAVDYRRGATWLKQAADATRLQILLMLAQGEMYVGSICAAVQMSQPAVSHHLTILRHSEMIEVRRAGKNNWYRLTDRGRSLAEAGIRLIGA